MSEITDSVVQTLTGTNSGPKPPKKLIQDALDANKRLQQILTHRAEQLEAALKEADELLESANLDEGEDDPESEILIPGARKATGLFSSSEFLNPSSPFYEEAMKRSNYIANTTPRPMKAKELDTLAAAVRNENERLRAYRRSQSQHSNPGLDTDIDLDNNIEGLDWARIAEKVSDSSSVKRTAAECRVVWIGDRHPRINHAEWSTSELSKLNSIVSVPLKEKKPIDWVNVAETLGTNRTPLDCMKRGLPQHRHNWTPDADQRLIKAVQSCGIDNWQLVARNVSEYVTAGQCQGRWQRTLNPALKRGAWAAEEDELLRKAVAGYGKSWVQVATAIPGRTNDQCRERWNEHVNLTSANIDWSEAEDKNLLGLVESLGNQWKVISFKIGNNKTGQNCRMRYDKLKRLQRKSINSSTRSSGGVTTGASNIAGPSQLVQMQNPEEGMSALNPTVGGQESFSQPPDTTLPIRASNIKPRPKPRVVRTGNTKESVPTGDPSAQILPLEPADGSQTPLAESPALVAIHSIPKKSRKKATEGTLQPDSINADFPVPQSRPKPRPNASNQVEKVAVLTETSADDSAATSGAPQPDSTNVPKLESKPKPRPKVSKKPDMAAALPEVPIADAGALAPAEGISTSAAASPILTRERKRKAAEPVEGQPNQSDKCVAPVSPDHVLDPAIPAPEPTLVSTSKRGRKRKTTNNAESGTAQRNSNPAPLSAEIGSTLSAPLTEPPLASTSMRGRKRKTTDSAESKTNLPALKKARTMEGTGRRTKIDITARVSEQISTTLEPAVATSQGEITGASTHADVGLFATLEPEVPKENPKLRRGRSSKVLSPTTGETGGSVTASNSVAIAASLTKRPRGRPRKVQAPTESNT